MLDVIGMVLMVGSIEFPLPSDLIDVMYVYISWILNLCLHIIQISYVFCSLN